MTGIISASRLVGCGRDGCGRGGYGRDGYAVVRSVVDASTLEDCRSHLAAMQMTRPPGSAILAVAPGSDSFLDSMAADERLAGLAGALLAGPVVCFGCTFMVKRAVDGPPALWHQDGHPWAERLGVRRAVTLWLALDDVTADNGALVVIPGSHWLPAQPLVPVAGDAGGMFGAGMDRRALKAVVAVAGPSPAGGAAGEGPGLGGAAGLGLGAAGPVGRVVEMAAGDVSAHHPWLVHGSAANRSAGDRRALVVRYRPA